MEDTNERFGEATLYQLPGDMLLARSSGVAADEAESRCRQPLEASRRQEAKLLELHAAVSLGRLWQRLGRPEDALESVRGVYGWFTEGCESVDLREARAFLTDLQDSKAESP